MSIHEPEVITRMHKIPGKEISLEMSFARCQCGEMSQWFPEHQYASAWADKHAHLMKTVGVAHPTKSLTVPRPETVYKQYRILQEDERYDLKDRALFKQMADELESRVKTGEPDPDQLELF